MSFHAKLSPSKAHRWTKCAGSIREEAKYPDVRGAAAVDGTHSHTLLEQCLRMGIPPRDFIGRDLYDDDGMFKVDKERAARVAIAYDYVTGRSGRIITETRVNPKDLLQTDECSGTVDVQIHDGDFAEIIDYKDGRNMVEVEGNEQLELYALGVLAENPHVNNFRLTIVQPRISMSPVRHHDLTREALMAKADFYRIAAVVASEPDAPLTPGDSQCKWCRAAGNCAALNVNVMEAINMFPSIDVAQQAADKNPNELSDQQLREIIEAAPLLRQLLDKVEEEALRRVQAGATITGLKAVYGRGSRSWAYDDEEMIKKLTRMGIPKKDVLETKLISPAKAEKLTWVKGDITKQLSDRQLKVLENEYIKKSQGKLTIVSESDRREAVIFNAAPMFPNQELPAWLR